MEDDPHCYHIALEIENSRVRDVSCDSIRTPWSLCGEADRSLSALVGMEVSPDMNTLLQQVDRSLQCTHMLDAAVLGISHAARGITWRQYDISVESWPDQREQNVSLLRDGVSLLELSIEGDHLVTPPELKGTSVKLLNQVMVKAGDSDDHREAVSILRRAIYISNNRKVDLDNVEVAMDHGPALGACYVYHKDRVTLATRIPGSTREFTHSTEGMISLVELSE